MVIVALVIMIGIVNRTANAFLIVLHHAVGKQGQKSIWGQKANEEATSAKV